MQIKYTVHHITNKSCQKVFPDITAKMCRQGDMKKLLTVFPQLQRMLPTMPSLPVR